MISLSTIQLFASTDETRYTITKPRVIGDVVVATDGRILVEAPLVEVEPFEFETPDCDFPDYRAIIDPQFREPFILMVLPPLPEKPTKFEVCQECGGGGYLGPDDCQKCKEAKRLKCTCWPCEDCDASGEFLDLSRWFISDKGVLLAGRYIEMTMNLPNLKWFEPARNLEPYPGAVTIPVRFTFGENGRGLLMQMKEEPK